MVETITLIRGSVSHVPVPPSSIFVGSDPLFFGESGPDFFRRPLKVHPGMEEILTPVDPGDWCVECVSL